MKLHRFNYAEVYLTLRCNLGCDYCINNVDGVVRNRKELTGKQWANALNRIDFGKTPLTLGGGEPTLHKDFYALLVQLSPKIGVDLLTNLQFDIDEFIKQTIPRRFTIPSKPHYRSIRASYHVEQMDQEDTIRRAKKLQDAGFNIGIFGINHPHFINENMEMNLKSLEAGVFFYPKDFLGEINGQMYGYFKYPEALDGERKQAMCRTKELLIAPDGLVYRCHRDLYHAENPVGDIQDPNLKIEDKFRPCSNYGLCNPCDVKLKTNRYLGGIGCQVEIK